MQKVKREVFKKVKKKKKEIRSLWLPRGLCKFKAVDSQTASSNKCIVREKNFWSVE